MLIAIENVQYICILRIIIHIKNKRTIMGNIDSKWNNNLVREEEKSNWTKPLSTKNMTNRCNILIL